jgi:hypothetical protein
MVLLDQTMNHVEVGTGESAAKLQRNRLKPKLGFRRLALNVNMGWLMAGTRVKEEAKRA